MHELVGAIERKQEYKNKGEKMIMKKQNICIITFADDKSIENKVTELVDTNAYNFVFPDEEERVDSDCLVIFIVDNRKKKYVEALEEKYEWIYDSQKIVIVKTKKGKISEELDGYQDIEFSEAVEFETEIKKVLVGYLSNQERKRKKERIVNGKDNIFILRLLEIFCGGISGIFLIFDWLFYIIEGRWSWNALWRCTCVPLFVVLLSELVIYFMKREERKEDTYSQKLQSVIGEEVVLEGGEEKNSMKKVKRRFDVLGFIKINLDEMNSYYRWSKTQAKLAFAIGVAACGVGVALIAIGIYVSSIGRIDASILTILAGVLTDVIAIIVLTIYKKSSEILNYYFKALHEDERFLACVNLLEQFDSDEKKDEILKKIIENELELNIQENQIGKQNDKKTINIIDNEKLFEWVKTSSDIGENELINGVE